MQIEGVHCAVHADRASIGTCEHCGAFACADCLGSLGGRLICRACVDAGRVGADAPWERRAELGAGPAAWQTIRDVTLTPNAFFEQLGTAPRLNDVIVLLLILGVVQGIVGAANGFLVNQALFSVLGIDRQSTGVPMLDWIQGGAGNAVVTLVMTPIGNVMGPMIVGSLAHGVLVLLGKRTVELAVTLRYVAYAYVIGIWGAIPIVGALTGVFAGLWTLVVTVIAVRSAHKSGTGPAALAVLGLPCGCGGLAAIAAIIVGAVVAGAGGL